MRLMTFQHIFGAAAFLALTGCVTMFPERTTLRDLEPPAESGELEVVETREIDGGTVYICQFRSQEWQGIVWTHWLTIFRPDDLRHTDTALLYIGTGSLDDTGPSRVALSLADHAIATGSIVAAIDQVPNQPLFDDLYEDDLIAFTFQRYLAGEGDDWPLLWPMVTSAVRAMDAVQDFAAEAHGIRPEQFVLTGASKRGWTTWLTAVEDPRVTAIAPMIFDMLNVVPQLEQQIEYYGKYSEMIAPYTERGIQEELETPEGQELAAMVDPFTYREHLTMPKLILLGTNDPYWTVDAANLYFYDLPGENHLYYAPNYGHNIDDGGMQALLGFYQSILTGAPMPTLEWGWDEGGHMVVQWDPPEGEARLWKAASMTRDFRDAEWVSQPIEANGRCYVDVDAPETGYGAFFVEVAFPETNKLPAFSLSTGITMVP